MRRGLGRWRGKALAPMAIVLVPLILLACATAAGFSGERSGGASTYTDEADLAPATPTPKASQKIAFIQGQSYVLSGSPFYEPLTSLEIKTPSSGYVVVQATGTITTAEAGIYVDIGVSTADDSVEWAHRAGMPKADLDGPLSWPFNVSHVFEAKSSKQGRFFLNARQMETDGVASVELGSMYAFWIEGPGPVGTK